MPPDLVKRFSPTPLAATLTVNGTSLRVATNDPLVLDRLRAASDAVARDSDQAPIAVWRIVVEEHNPSECDFTLDGFIHGGLSFIRIAHRSFLAGDLQGCCGISFIDKNLIRNEQHFKRIFFPAFMSMLDEMKEAA